MWFNHVQLGWKKKRGTFSTTRCNKNESVWKKHHQTKFKTDRHVTTNKGIGLTHFSDFLVLLRFMPFPCSVHLIGWVWRISLRDNYASNRRMIKSTGSESDYDNAVNNNVWLMDGGWCAWKSVLEVCFRLLFLPAICILLLILTAIICLLRFV